jgi:hypothetical protein
MPTPKELFEDHRKNYLDRKFNDLNDKIDEITTQPELTKGERKAAQFKKAAFWWQTAGLLVLFVAWIWQNTSQKNIEGTKQEFDYQKLIDGLSDYYASTVDLQLMEFRIQKELHSDSLLSIGGALGNAYFYYASRAVNDYFTSDSTAKSLGYLGAGLGFTRRKYDSLGSKINRHKMSLIVDEKLNPIYLDSLERDYRYFKSISMGEMDNIRAFLIDERNDLISNSEAANSKFLIAYILGSICLAIGYILKNLQYFYSRKFV